MASMILANLMRLADSDDIVAMKLQVIQNTGRKKDFGTCMNEWKIMVKNKYYNYTMKNTHMTITGNRTSATLSTFKKQITILIPIASEENTGN